MTPPECGRETGEFRLRDRLFTRGAVNPSQAPPIACPPVGGARSPGTGRRPLSPPHQSSRVTKDLSPYPWAFRASRGLGGGRGNSDCGTGSLRGER
jgi:hypothetical protein